MYAVVCASQNWGIGCNGDLLFHIPADMKHFRTLTTGKPVILGFKTLSTFPGGKPLPNRRNIILTHKDISIDGAEIAHSVEEARDLAGDDAVVIGGSSIYNAFLPYCDRVYVTKVHANRNADRFFPNLSADPAWKIEKRSGPMGKDITYRYVTYIRK